MSTGPKMYVDREEHEYEVILKIQRNRNKMFVKHKDTVISEKTLNDILEDVKGRLGTPNLSFKTLELIIRKYPMTKAELIEFGSSDTEAFSQLADSIVNFFLNSYWPKYGDKVDIDKFTEVLNKEITYYENNDLDS